jgi:hypothetical protein
MEDKTCALLWGLDAHTRSKLVLSHQEARLRKRWIQVEQELASQSTSRRDATNKAAAAKRKRRSLFPDDPSPPSDDGLEEAVPSTEVLNIDPGHMANLTYVYSTLGTGYKDSVPLPPKAILKALYDTTQKAPFYDVDHLSLNQVCRLSDQAWRMDAPDVEGAFDCSIRCSVIRSGRREQEDCQAKADCDLRTGARAGLHREIGAPRGASI